MAVLQVIHAPNSIFKQKAKLVAVIDEEIRRIAQDMLDTMYEQGAVGLGANMVGIDKQIIVLDLRENGERCPYVMINPEIIEQSEEQVEFEEASLSFPGISAKIKRPANVTVNYLGLDGNNHTLKAKDFLSRVIQHEIDYLYGIVYLDKLSSLKKDILLKKMLKYIKFYQPHVHDEHCNHHHH